MCFFRQNTNLFIGELPAVGDITLTAYMRFIPVQKVYFSLLAQRFKFYKLFYFIFINRRMYFPY
ncbi:hypothetical protein EZS27_008691 [termite gut metagenome]|uniref:Uncharacterized protein n=1 Tax=termite gut metagenome TaxID=433724 RepID=A0A5J4SBV2_9ZZZZ